MNTNTSINKLFLVAIVLCVASLACNLPINDFRKPISAPIDQDQQKPAATVIIDSSAPTLAQPTANAGASNSDTTPPSINTIKVLEDPVYYGASNCGTTSLSIEAVVKDDSGNVSQVGIQYRYNGYAANAVGSWRKANLKSTGADKFSITIHVDNEADSDMKGNDGVMEFQIYAFDPAGNTQTEPLGQVLGVQIKKCVSQSSNQQPPSSNTDKTAPTISNVNTSSAPAYYNGATCGPTTLTLEANVNDNSNNIKNVIARYRYNGYAANAIGNFREIPMTVSGGKYKLTINIDAEANQDMNNNNGVLEYQIIATDAAGNAQTYPSGGHPLGVEVKNCNPGGVVSNNPPQGSFISIWLST